MSAEHGSTEEAVEVHLALAADGLGSEDDQARVFALEDQLIEAIEDAEVGEYDGHAFGEGEAVLYMYGPDADALFEVVEPILRDAQLAPGSSAIKRHGDVEDENAPEDTVPLA